jgi:hypothetical protein
MMHRDFNLDAVTHPAHARAFQDDSGVSSVVVCFCGRSFLAFGADRWRDAQRAHEAHRYSAALQLWQGRGGRLPRKKAI